MNVNVNVNEKSSVVVVSGTVGSSLSLKERRGLIKFIRIHMKQVKNNMIDFKKQAKQDAIDAKKQAKQDAIDAKKQAKQDAIDVKNQAKQDAIDAKNQAKQDAIDAKKQAKQDAIDAKKQAKQDAIDAKKEAKKLEIDAKKAAKKLEIDAKKAADMEAVEAKKSVAREFKRMRTVAVRTCVKNLSELEKARLVEDYLQRLVGDGTCVDDIDQAQKKVTSTEWQKMVIMNWNDEGGNTFIPDAYKMDNKVE